MFIAWLIVNSIVALGFAALGVLKLVRSREQLVAFGQGWAADFTPARIRLIGVAEVLGAIGLVVPIATGIAPLLSVVAALALGFLMTGAIAIHLRRAESTVFAVVFQILAYASAGLGIFYFATA